MSLTLKVCILGLLSLHAVSSAKLPHETENAENSGYLAEFLGNFKTGYETFQKNAKANSELQARQSVGATAYVMNPKTYMTFPFLDGADFQTQTGYDGTQRLIFTINEYFNCFEFYEMLYSQLYTDNSIVIAIRWAGYQAPYGPPTAVYPGDYANKVSEVPHTATYIQGVISSISESSGFTVDPSSIDIVGTGLGVHVAGQVGNLVPGISTIIALQPLFEGFEAETVDDKDRLTLDDAEHIAVVHFGYDEYTIRDPIGHSDYYILSYPPFNEFYFEARYFYEMLYNAMMSFNIPYGTKRMLGAPMEMSNARDVIKTLFPQAYPCQDEEAFWYGECLEGNVPLPALPFLEKVPGIYYHAASTLPSTFGVTNNNPALMYEPVKMLSTQMQVVVEIEQDESMGMIEAFFSVSLPTAQDYSVGPVMLLDYTDAIPGKATTLVTVPMMYVEGELSMTVNFRHVAFMDSVKPFYVKELSVKRRYADINSGPDYGIAEASTVVLRACNLDLLENTPITIDFKTYQC